MLGINPRDFVPVIYSSETMDFLVNIILFIFLLYIVVINDKGTSGLLNMNGGHVIQGDKNDNNKVGND